MRPPDDAPGHAVLPILMPRVANSLKAGKILLPRRLGLVEMAKKLGFPANSLAGEQRSSDPGTNLEQRRKITDPGNSGKPRPPPRAAPGCAAGTIQMMYDRPASG
jgi:hypothetical protein